MPVRKSNVSAVSNDDSAATKAAAKDDGLSIEDLTLPRSIVQRLGKGVLPPNTQIQKDALLAMSKSATVFVNYLTSCAAEMAARNNKKTVMPQDVFDAMSELEFEAFLPRLQAEVTKFTFIQADKRNSYRKKVREDKKAAKDGSGENSVAAVNGTAYENGHGNGNGNGNGHKGDEDEDSPPMKRVRRSSVDNGEHITGSEEEVDGEEAADAEQEDEEVEEDEIEDEAADEGLTEDPLEVRESEPSDDDMVDGNESD